MAFVTISAISSGSGKTTVVCGILKALKNMRLKVSACKCGPDYIDTMFHTNIIGIPSKNIDSFFCDDNLLKEIFYDYSDKSDITIIEGVMGYYDGLSMGSLKASTYYISKIINSPVVLIINAKGMALTINAVIKGIMEYAKDNDIRGIILNNVSKNVYKKLKEVIESEIDIEVLGYMPFIEDCAIESRHLGLITPQEIENINKKIEKLGEVVKECINVERFIEIAKSAEKLEYKKSKSYFYYKRAKIGIAFDKAFCFYYKDNIDVLEKLGCEIEYFSPMYDKEIPKNIDGLILGGGYPELYCDMLSDNEKMLKSVKENIEMGMPCLAECGGFMYLHKNIENAEKNKYKMVGLIDADCYKCNQLVRFGYITLCSKKDNYILKKGEEIKAHEFHYWDSTNNGNMFVAEKPEKSKNWECIYGYKNLMGGFPHIFYKSNISFVENFVKKCIEYKEIK